MAEVFEFELVFALPEGFADEDALLDALFEAGCDDGTVLMGAPGLVGVALERAAEDAEAAIGEAAAQVAAALPAGSVLREVRPDLVSLADVAARLNVTRQALQKRRMPPPAVAGLYRASEVRRVLEGAGAGKIAGSIAAARPWFAAAEGAQRVNARIALGEYRP